MFDFKNGEYIGVLPQTPYSTFRSREKGGIDQYDFNIAFNISDRVYLGLTIGAYDVDYTKSYYYSEDYGDKQNYNIGSMNRISGSGFDFKMGDMNQNREFRLKTPWKYNVSLGYTVGQNLAIGAEYEYEDYSSVKFRYPEGDKMEFETNAAKMVMKGVNTFRIGAEYKVIPQFAFRLGYNYSSSIFKNGAIKYLPYNSVNTDTDFANSKSLSNYTLGIGYRGTMIYADLAYKLSSYK